MQPFRLCDPGGTTYIFPKIQYVKEFVFLLEWIWTGFLGLFA